MSHREPVLSYAALPPGPKRRANWVAVAIGVSLALPTAALFHLVTYLFLAPLLAGLCAAAIGIIGHRPSPSARRWRSGTLIAAGLGLFSVSGPCLLIMLADRSGAPVHFVLPNGFHGKFRLVRDAANGLDVPARDGRYTYAIPPSGLLTIRELRPLESWHEETAAYADGSPIWPQAIPSGFVLYCLGSGAHSGQQGSEQYIDYLVGTAADLQAAQKDWHLPLGRVEEK